MTRDEAIKAMAGAIAQSTANAIVSSMPRTPGRTVAVGYENIESALRDFADAIAPDFSKCDGPAELGKMMRELRSHPKTSAITFCDDCKSPIKVATEPHMQGEGLRCGLPSPIHFCAKCYTAHPECLNPTTFTLKNPPQPVIFGPRPSAGTPPYGGV